MIRPGDLISPAYLRAQITMHADPRGYGSHGDRWAETAKEIIARYQVGSVLDYGCGEGTLTRALRGLPGVLVRDYDPAIKGKDTPPVFADLVTCTDVLEHIEPDRLDTVLAHIRSLARKAALLVVSIRPANKRLPDGRNAHLIIEGREWWQARIEQAGFTIQDPPTVLPAKGTSKVWIGVVTP